MFMQGHAVLKLMSDHFEYIWDHGRIISLASKAAAELLQRMEITVRPSLVLSEERAPFWARCSRNHRVSLEWISPRSTTAAGRCQACSQYLRISRKDVATATVHAKIIPRVLTDDLLDCIAWRHIAGCGYRGGLEHYILSAVVASYLGFQPLPEFLNRRMEQRGLQDVVPSEYINYLKMRISDSPAVSEAARLLRAGRGSIGHWLLWHDDRDRSILARVSRSLAAV